MRKVAEITVTAPIVTLGMGKRELNRAIKEFQAHLNQDRVGILKLRRPRKARLSSNEVIQLMQGTAHLPSQSEIVDGRLYVRTCDWGNPSSEALVRTNLKQFIYEFRQVIFRAAEQKQLGTLMDMCRSYEDGMRISGFFTASGTKLGRNLAFAHTITQFFKDEQMVLTIFIKALQEISKKPSSEVPVVGSVNS